MAHYYGSHKAQQRKMSLKIHEMARNPLEIALKASETLMSPWENL